MLLHWSHIKLLVSITGSILPNNAAHDNWEDNCFCLFVFILIGLWCRSMLQRRDAPECFTVYLHWWVTNTPQYALERNPSTCVERHRCPFFSALYNQGKMLAQYTAISLPCSVASTVCLTSVLFKSLKIWFQSEPMISALSVVHPPYEWTLISAFCCLPIGTAL